MATKVQLLNIAKNVGLKGMAKYNKIDLETKLREYLIKNNKSSMLDEIKNTKPTSTISTLPFTKYFVKPMQTKIKKLLWARANMSPICNRHDRANLRMFMTYDKFKQVDCPEFRNNYIDHSGIVIIAPPSIINSTEEQDKYLISLIGSKNPITCVIGFERKGTQENKKEMEQFITYAKDQGWCELNHTKSKIGNKDIIGEYFCDLRGAGKDTINIGCVPTGNDCLEYADKNTVNKITCQLVYMMLCIPDAEKLLIDPTKLQECKTIVKKLCDDNNLNDFSLYPVNPFDNDGHLRCWSGEKMYASSFLNDSTSHAAAQKCHIDSVATAIIKFNKEKKELITVCRPYNFLWGTRRANLTQSQGSITEALEYLGKPRIEALEKENEALRCKLKMYEEAHKN